MLDQPEQLRRERLLRQRRRSRRGPRGPAPRRRRRRQGPRACPRCERPTSCTAPSPVASERTSADRRLAVERAAALLEQRRLLRQRRVAVELEQLRARSPSPRAARGVPPELLREHAVVGVEVAQVVRRASRRAPRADAARQLDSPSASSSPCSASSCGRTSSPSSAHRPHPGQVVEPDLVDDDALRLDAEQARERALEADRDVAEADGAMAGVEQRARDDPDRVREVDDPGAVGGALARRCSAIPSTTGTVRNAFASPPAPVVSWPMQPHASGTVSSREPRLLAADADLDEHEVGSVERAVEVVRRLEPTRRSPGASSIRRASPPTTSSRSASMSCSTSSRTSSRLALARAPETSSGV